MSNGIAMSCEGFVVRLSNRPLSFLAKCVHVRDTASPSGTAIASEHSAHSGGESNNDFTCNNKFYAVSRNETYTAKHGHPHARQTTL